MFFLEYVLDPLLELKAPLVVLLGVAIGVASIVTCFLFYTSFVNRQLKEIIEEELEAKIRDYVGEIQKKIDLLSSTLDTIEGKVKKRLSENEADQIYSLYCDALRLDLIGIFQKLREDIVSGYDDAEDLKSNMKDLVNKAILDRREGLKNFILIDNTRLSDFLEKINPIGQNDILEAEESQKVNKLITAIKAEVKPPDGSPGKDIPDKRISEIQFNEIITNIFYKSQKTFKEQLNKTYRLREYDD